MNKHLVIVLLKMCEAVGADFRKIDFKKENWFMEYTWTHEQENEFIKWLSDYLYRNEKALEAFSAFPRKTRKHCLEVAELFTLNHRWEHK